jgi:predicted permease
MTAMLRNLRLVLCQLLKAPGFSLTVVLTLALGIGATTAIFSLVEGIFLRPLPFQDSERLVRLGDHVGENSGLGVTAGEVDTYRKASGAFSSLGGFATADYELSGGAVPERINAGRLDFGVFPTLGVRPLMGRVFTRQEDEGHQPLAVIGYGLWVERYHRDPQVLGKTIDLDRKTYSIIGVMPRGFEFPLVTGHLDQVQLWVPLSFTAEELSEKGDWRYQMVGRLRDGVTLPQAAQDTDRVAQQIMRNFPASMSAIHIRGDVSSVREDAVSDARPLLRTLFLAVSIVLLLACVNVAGLLLVRAIRRRREYAVRLALGASSGVIVRASVLEGLVLGLTGGVLGLAFAAGVIRTTLHLLPESMPRIDSISMNGTVAAFAVVLALATGAVCSLLPAFAALRTNPIESLKEGSQTGSASSSHVWLRSSLVVSEIAIALVLLTVAGAFLRSFQKMRAVDPGFRPDHVLVAKYQLPIEQYATGASIDAFNKAVTDKLSSKPGIIATGITNFLPASGSYGMSGYTRDDQRADNWKLKFAAFSTVYGDYFHAMGIQLLAGRYFDEHDGPDAPPVVIVNESMAKHSWPGRQAIGRRMHAGNPNREMPWATVVGIVADTKPSSRDLPTGDQWYTPTPQPTTLGAPGPTGKLINAANGYIVLRSALPPEQMAQTLRATVAEVDPLLALQQVQPMDDVIANVEAPRRFNTDLITAFAAGALLLAVTGIYAVVAFSVTLRTQEIAIRMAVGAQRASIARLVLLSGGKLALLGCCFGVLGSLAVSRLVRSFLFGVTATDPVVFVASVTLMLLLALLASAIPALRAASADPLRALRSN